MHFTAAATSNSQYNDWLQLVRASAQRLDASAYHQLAHPSQNNPAQLFSSTDSNLCEKIILKYMVPGQGV